MIYSEIQYKQNIQCKQKFLICTMNVGELTAQTQKLNMQTVMLTVQWLPHDNQSGNIVSFIQ